MLSILKDGSYQPFVCAMDCEFSPSLETKPVRTIGDGRWKKPRGQSFSYSVSLSGLVELEGIYVNGFHLLENYFMQALPVPFRMTFYEPKTGLIKFITGQALIVSAPFTGPTLDFANCSFQMEGYGIPVITNTPNNCEASIGYLAITDSEAGQITIEWNFVIGAVRFDYTIDDGGRESVYDPGSSGTLVITGISEGVHTLTVYPICENGNDGFPQVIEFEMTGGGAETCEPPTTVEFGSITNSSALASWSIPGSPPADGFAWELAIASNPGVSVQSGTTPDDYLNLSSLLANTEYVLRVRSLCEEGVSESGWTSGSFTTSAAPGANAVSYGFFPGESSGSMTINKNGVEVVFVDELTDSFFAAIDGDEIEIIGTGTGTVDIYVVDTTSSTVIINHDTGSGTLTRSFTTASGHNYNIDVTLI